MATRTRLCTQTWLNIGDSYGTYYIHLFVGPCLQLAHTKHTKKNDEILAALQYKPLYNISRSEKWGKKIQAAAYNGACRAHELTVLILYIPSTVVVAT